jgi:hypothetical protein
LTEPKDSRNAQHFGAVWRLKINVNFKNCTSARVTLFHNFHISKFSISKFVRSEVKTVFERAGIAKASQQRS